MSGNNTFIHEKEVNSLTLRSKGSRGSFYGPNRGSILFLHMYITHVCITHMRIAGIQYSRDSLLASKAGEFARF